MSASAQTAAQKVDPARLGSQEAFGCARIGIKQKRGIMLANDCATSVPLADGEACRPRTRVGPHRIVHPSVGG